MSTIRGTTAAQFNGITVKYTDTGRELTRTYEGPKEAVAALINDLRDEGFEVTYQEDKSPLATIVASYPAEAVGQTGTITDTENSPSGLFTAPSHELLNGDAIQISGIVGITSTTTYYIGWVSADTFYLYSNFNLSTKVYPTNDNDTGTFTKMESPTPRWELFSEVREVPVCDARYIDKLGGTQLSNAARKVLRKLVDGQYDYTEEEYLLFTTSEQTALLTAVEKAGLRTISYDVPVVTVTKTVTRGFSNSAAMTNVGKILATSQLTTLEGMETGLLDGLTEFSTMAGTVIGWRKSFPRREALGGGRFSISQKFEYDWWSSALFVAA